VPCPDQADSVRDVCRHLVSQRPGRRALPQCRPSSSGGDGRHHDGRSTSRVATDPSVMWPARSSSASRRTKAINRVVAASFGSEGRRALQPHDPCPDDSCPPP